MTIERKIAYFSMELALEPRVPTYSGGLGVLAGDTIRSAADLALPVVAVTLLHRQGYFEQILDEHGRQQEQPDTWSVEDHLEPLEPRIRVPVNGRSILVRAWQYTVRGATGGRLPVYLLDTDLPENNEEDRTLTDFLYGGDDRYRLAQEMVLGLGGVRMLRALGHQGLARFHMNEGHAALVVLALLQECNPTLPEGHDKRMECIERARRHCVFTTHTPVPAGHDRFSRALVESVFDPQQLGWLEELGQHHEVNMTDVALRGSRFVNGVALRHGEVSRGMFPGYPIRSITNGIHPPTWASPSFRALFDLHIPEWRRDSLSLRYAVNIPLGEIWWAHMRAKQALVEHVNTTTGSRLDPEVFTIGLARRATAYKRATLVLRDPERLAAIGKAIGRVQIVFAGKAHPRDEEGKALIRRIFEVREALAGRIEIAYLPNYAMDTARLLCAGSDLWLNTPIPPREASGTSGMKAALNGVPSLSVLDGWWVEGHVEGITGWAIGGPYDGQSFLHEHERDDADAEALYRALSHVILPRFYHQPEHYQETMRYAIALNASFFNTHRMVLQYLYEAYGDLAEDVPR